jgi:HD superfamily phosphohydrolase
MTQQTVSTKEVDYLDEDKAIRGQNYVCLSFLSPEEILKEKEVYYFEKYLANFSRDLDQLLQGIAEKYKDESDAVKIIRENNNHLFKGDELQEHYRFFKRTNEESIEREFLEKNDFRTSVRGIKVRGVFETLKEAQVRAELLRRMGDTKFDIFVGQVGVWCPWSPNPEDIQEQEYAETQLNTLMKQYKNNMTQKDEFYELRKQEKMADAQKKLQESLAKKDPLTERKEAEAAAAAATEIDPPVNPTIEEMDTDPVKPE